VRILGGFLVALVAALHIGFLVLEMFLWTTPFGLRTFNLTPEFAAASAPLAANQGLYNGFLAAGLIWGLLARESAFAIKVFFLVCVIVAGVFGAATAKGTILFVQALPAAIALLVLFFSRRAKGA
jgi:putative membrane protein